MAGELQRAAGIIAWKPGPEGPRFLLLRNSRHATWGFAKGHLEPGEDDVEGARREFEEETGLPAPALVPGFRVQTEHEHQHKGQLIHKVVTYFLGESVPGEVRSSPEHDAVLWADEAQARKTLQFDSLRDVITAAARALEGNPRLIMSQDRIDLIRGLIRDVPDFPKPGILFKDISPLLGHGEGFRTAVDLLAELAEEFEVDVIAGPEARGFVFGAPLATKLGLGFAPIRKKGKLPWKTIEETYDLEYGTDTLQMHEDAVLSGQRVLLVDDLLATGGTIAACRRLAEQSGAIVVAAAFVIELAFLGGRAKTGDLPLRRLIEY